MENTERAQDALQLEALLLSRAYLYTLFHKLLGGAPDQELLEALLDDTTADVLEEFAGASEELQVLGAFLSTLRAGERGELADRAHDEYTRVFIGPGALPASPYESPYTGAHDMSVFQENTLAVRAAYHAQGLRVRREQAVPDDHIALLCAFMAEQVKRSLAALRDGRLAELGGQLREQHAFAQMHLASWLGIYAKSVRNSKAGASAVLYPQMLEGLDAFVRADLEFLTESAFWAEGQEEAEAQPSGAAPELAEAQEALKALAALRPFGIQDNELVSCN